MLSLPPAWLLPPLPLFPALFSEAERSVDWLSEVEVSDFWLSEVEVSDFSDFWLSEVSEEPPFFWLSPPPLLPPALFSVRSRSVFSEVSPPPLFSVVWLSVVPRSVVVLSEVSMVKVCSETLVTVWLVAVSLWWEPVSTRRYSPLAASVGAGRLPWRLPLASTVSSPRV